ncbi:MAG: putative phage-like protein, partial [Rhodospirillaceae bacterium]
MSRYRTDCDWEAIEREYRADQISIRQIARQYEITDRAIRKRALAERWERDLTHKVAAKVRSDLVRTEVRTPHARGPDEREIVTAAAARGVEVILRHRKDCVRLAESRDRMLLRLEGLEPDAVDLRSCAQLADTLESATRMTERLQNAERRLFNLDAVSTQQDDDVTKRDQDAILLLRRL